MPIKLIAAALTLALLLAACAAGSSDPTTVAESSPTTGGTADTTDSPDNQSALDCEATAAAFATNGSANANLPDPESSATCDGDTVTVTSNGIPDYPYVETSPGDPVANNLVFTIPADPQIADEPTDIALLGAVAIAVDGVPIYGPTEGQGGDVLSLEGALNECGSHNGPTGFHYHLHETSDSAVCMHTPEEAASGPQLFGFSLDGFPIYSGSDQYTSSWELTNESLFATDTWAAHTFVEGSGDLDQCNGLRDDAGYYAYYTTETFPYVLGCYSGVVDLDTALGGNVVAGGGPGFRPGPP